MKLRSDKLWMSSWQLHDRRDCFNVSIIIIIIIFFYVVSVFGLFSAQVAEAPHEDCLS